MVRGRGGYSSRGGGRGNSYRSSGSTYNRMGGSRKPDFNDTGYRGGNSRYNSGYNSYDSRSRDKFQSRYDNRHDSKRSYRDTSRDRSDDRKRPRQEDSRLSSNYASTSSYRSRNDTSRNRMSSPSGNYQGRGSSSTYHRGQREDSAGRRHTTTSDSMGPPKRPMRSSYVVRPRGSGTASRARGSGSARGGMRVIRKESMDMKIMRRKLLLARQRDRARLIKIARLTSSLRKRKGPRSSESPSGHKSRSGDKKSDDDDDDEDEDMEEDEEEEVDVDADEDEESGKAKEKRDKKKRKSSTASIKKDPDNGEDAADDETGKDGEESDKDDDNEDVKAIKKEDAEEGVDEDVVEGDDDETKEGKNTSTTKSNGDGATEDEKDSKDTSLKEKKSKDRKEESSKESSRRKRASNTPPRRPKFIKLTCVHCRMNCVTFKEYTIHLYSRMHKMAMRRVAIRQRVTLSRMRTQQRNAQRDIEEKSKDDLDEVKPQFCLLCRLNYRQPKAKHQLSEHHKDMKKFLMPYCQTCHLAFKSPMLYEAHRCSLEHIRRKARSNEANSDVSADEEKEVDLKNFMTVDSVGEIDELDDEDLENHLGEDANKEKVPVGSHFIKKVEAFYCELCRTYNGIKEDEEAYIRQHCGSRSHLKAFLRHREDENLQAKAERVEKKENKKKESTETEKKTEGGEDAEEAVEDKLWEDVDKDLGDLLREVGPDEHDEEEEEEEDESVLNIDIESEKSKPSKEVNGKKEETTEEEKPKPKEPSTPVVKIKKEKLDGKSSTSAKASPASKDKDKKAEAASE